MARQVQRPQVHQQTEKQELAAMPKSSPSENGERLKAELDDILDEIDGVLESEAAEFVKGFIQKGGE